MAVEIYTARDKVIEKIKKLNTKPPETAKNFEPILIVYSETFFYAQYSWEKKLCVLDLKIIPYIGAILSPLNSKVSYDVILYISIPIEDKDCIEYVNILASNGFENPFITNVSVFTYKIPLSIVLTRKNFPTVEYDPESILNNVLYCIQELEKDHCSLHAQFTENALELLKKASKTGIMVNGFKNGNAEKSKNSTQKELTGTFHVEGIVQEKERFIFLIGLNEKNIEPGEEENVSVNFTRYNFHSHPEEAYVRYSIKNAWPSMEDYLGCLKLGLNTIFHCVVALEGLYVISLTPYWAYNIKKIKTSFIEKHYNVYYDEDYTPSSYVKKINETKCKGHPIFFVRYLSWKGADKIFSVNYIKTGEGCIPTQKSMEAYKRLEVHKHPPAQEQL